MPPTPEAAPTPTLAPTLAVDWIDWTVIVVYILGIVGLGCWAGWRRKSSEGAGYFLADKSLTWPIIGLALFSTNISTIHLVSLAQSGYETGLAMGNFEWMAAFTLICLSLFFAPFYLRSRVTTLPDFLEKRFSRPCRDWFAAVSILSAVFVHLGFALYTGAVVLEGFLLNQIVDNPEEWRLVTLLVIAGLTGLYTIVGGLMAVVLTESVQTIVLLVGACCITVIGYHTVGGWEALQGTVADIASESPKAAHEFGNHLSVWRAHGDASDLPWYSVLLGYPVLGLWYWCADQTIVQRVLGAKDENHARVGPLFAGFIKILPVFIFVLPGVICLALIHQGKLPALPPGDDGSPDSKHTLAALITGLLPPGLKGIMAAALLAALMSTVSGALNSIATLFSYDLVKRWRPDVSDKRLVTVGRVVTFFAMLAAVAWSLELGDHFKRIFEGNQKMITYICPPVTALFIWGVFLRHLNATAAIVTAWFGTILGVIVFFLDFNGYLAAGAGYFGFTVPFLMIAVYLFAVCSLILFAVSWSKKATTLVAAIGTCTATPAAMFLFVACMQSWFSLPDVTAKTPHDWGAWGPYLPWLMIPGFILAAGSPLLLALLQFIPAQPDSPEADNLVWKNPLEALRGNAWRGLGDYRILTGILVAVMVCLYWVFS